MNIKKFFKKYATEIFVILTGLFLGTFLMFSSFNKVDNTLLISTKAWSDFASHIPLIRSFSLGLNFPPEYPLFAGPVIKYHFGFYMGVGLLEKIGIPIDLALNIPAILGFILLIFIIYYFAFKIFKSKIVGLLSILFFIFNSSLTYIYYFQKNPISIRSLLDIYKIKDFQSFAPYGDGVISAFWNLNIYTNQRHLPLSFAVSILIIYAFLIPIIKNKKVNYKFTIFLGLILGLTFFLHFAVLLMTASTIFFLGLLFKKLRKSAFIVLLISGLISLPQYLFINSDGSSSYLAIKIGYLISNNLNAFSFAEFWILNLGISIILIPLGFFFANNLQRKIFLSIIPIFLIGNIFQFSPEIAANHKFFNFFLIIANMYSAYALFILWNKKNYLKPIIIITITIMILGGIIDFFPLVNDKKVSIPDYELNPESQWILNNTNPKSVFLNTIFLYDPASLAGRKVFFGWPYFAWSQGYDTDSRGIIFDNLLGAESKIELCELVSKTNIDYIEISYTAIQDDNIPTISSLYNDINPVYSNNNGYKIFNIKKICN